MKAVNENLRYYTAFIVLAVLALFFLDHVTNYQTGYAGKGGCHGKRCPPPSTGTGTCTVTNALDGSTIIYAGKNYTIAGTGFTPGSSLTVYVQSGTWTDNTFHVTADANGWFSIPNHSDYPGPYTTLVYAGTNYLTSCPFTVLALGT